MIYNDQLLNYKNEEKLSYYYYCKALVGTAKSKYPNKRS